jgi:hypothetical protein
MLIKNLGKEITSGKVGPNAPKGLGGFTINPLLTTIQRAVGILLKETLFQED